jgi:2'-hydroxyisoflavone reductase
MKLLVLGGTLFLGRHVADAARARGHDVAVFHRGTRQPHRPDLVDLRGDRDPERGLGLGALEGGDWDAVIDTSGYFPRHARASVDLLCRRGARSYVFVSSVNAYPDPPAGLTEDEPTHEPLEAEALTFETYGPMKVGCERAVLDPAGFGDRGAVVRAGLIVGPEDQTNRLGYWVTRIAAGGDVLAPDVRDQPVQVVDARDLAELLVRIAEARRGGVVNVQGPRGAQTFGGLLERIAVVTGARVRFHWVPPDRLAQAGVSPWSELPLWAPPRYAAGGVMDGDDRRARAWGARFRPIEETIRDTLAWARQAPPPRGLDAWLELPAAGIDRDREAALLAALSTSR